MPALMGRVRRVLAALRRAAVIRRFRWRAFWLGPEAANMVFLSISSDLLAPLLKSLGVSIGAGADMNAPILFHNQLHRRKPGRPLGYDKLTVGEGCHVGRDCFFDLWESVTLGDRAVVSMRCTFLTHLSAGRSSLRTLYPTASAPITIGADSYIGAGATILKGVTLGRRCLVAAGSVVTRSFDDGCLIAGVPARKIRDLPEVAGGPETA